MVLVDLDLRSRGGAGVAEAAFADVLDGEVIDLELLDEAIGLLLADVDHVDPDEASLLERRVDVVGIVDRPDPLTVVLQRRDHRRSVRLWTDEHLFDTVASWQAESPRSLL